MLQVSQVQKRRVNSESLSVFTENDSNINYSWQAICDNVDRACVKYQFDHCLMLILRGPQERRPAVIIAFRLLAVALFQQ